MEVGDINGDGIPDLVSDSVYVAYGLGKGKFSTPVYFPNDGGASQVVLGNLRSKDLLDVVTNSTFYGDSALLNNGKGGLIEGLNVPFPSGASCTVQADFNGDGIPDLGVVENNTSFTIMFGTGVLKDPFRTGPSFPVPFADPDPYYGVCVTNAGDINGDGTFKTPVTFINANTGVIGYVTWADFNGDGKLDFLVGGEFNIFTMLSQPGGGFVITQFQGLNIGGTDPGTGDLNGDGAPDIVFGSAIDDIAICLNDGHGNFTSAPIYLRPYGLTAAGSPVVTDVNGDGLNDIVIPGEESTAIYTNLGNATFGQPEYFGEVNPVGGLFLGNWHGQSASAGKPDMFQFYGTGGGVLMPNTTK